MILEHAAHQLDPHRNRGAIGRGPGWVDDDGTGHGSWWTSRGTITAVRGMPVRPR